MPIHEYLCKACGRQFEHLLLPAAKTEPVCPACRSRNLEKLMSGFAVSSSERTKANVKAARKQIAQVALCSSPLAGETPCGGNGGNDGATACWRYPGRDAPRDRA